MIEQWRALICGAAKKHGLSPALLAAVVETESGGDQWATRFEPGYIYLAFVRIHAENNRITCATEEVHQKTSFGLMQIMGGVARELGHVRQLPEIFVPELNLDLGCRHLKAKQQRYGDDPVHTYAAYNAGSLRKLPSGFFVNQKNVDRFHGIYQTLALTFKGD